MRNSATGSFDNGASPLAQANARRAWIDPTAQQIKECERLLRRGGWTCCEIAQRLGIGWNAVSLRKRTLGLLGWPGTPPKKIVDTVYDLAATGAPIETIVERAQVGPAFVRRVIRRLPNAAKEAEESRRLPWGILRDGAGNTLFVPTRSMWAIHSASTPAAIVRRAGLKNRQFQEWKARYRREWGWLDDWLHGSPRPPNVTLLYPATQYYLVREPRETEFVVTPEMLRFREQATIVAINRAAGSQAESLIGPLPGELPWIRRFLLRGEKPPATMPHGAPLRVLTAAELDRCARAWDFIAIQCAGRSPIAPGTYWRDVQLLPERGFAYWMQWLFGDGVPERWHVLKASDPVPKEALAHSGKRGAIAPGVFRPFLWMEQFREEASKLRTATGIWRLAPGGDSSGSKGRTAGLGGGPLASDELFQRLLILFTVPAKIRDAKLASADTVSNPHPLAPPAAGKRSLRLRRIAGRHQGRGRRSGAEHLAQ